MHAYGVPGTPDGSELSLSKAKGLVSEHRWIHVNASMKKRWEAQHNASILSKAIRRPLVLVFMSRSITDGKRNEFDPNFVKNLGALASHGIGDTGTLLVTARSYGNSQALHFRSLIASGCESSRRWRGARRPPGRRGRS
jgi:hypothetical protein